MVGVSVGVVSGHITHHRRKPPEASKKGENAYGMRKDKRGRGNGRTKDTIKRKDCFTSQNTSIVPPRDYRTRVEYGFGMSKRILCWNNDCKAANLNYNVMTSMSMV